MVVVKPAELEVGGIEYGVVVVFTVIGVTVIGKGEGLNGSTVAFGTIE